MALGIEVTADGPSGVGQAAAEAVKEAVGNAAQAGFAESQDKVPEAFGDLKESGSLNQGDGVAGFGYDADHAPWVEGGTGPHYPPIEPLKEWAGLVLGDRSAAWAVQEKIAQEGTDPQPFMQPGFLTMSRELQRQDIPNEITGRLSHGTPFQ